MKRHAFIALAAVALAGCPAAINTACAIIDVADKTCAVVQVQGPDGGTLSVSVTREELQKFALERQAAHVADGGAK